MKMVWGAYLAFYDWSSVRNRSKNKEATHYWLSPDHLSLDQLLQKLFDFPGYLHQGMWL